MHVRDRLAKSIACGFMILLLCGTSTAWADEAVDVEALKATSWWTEVQKNLHEQEYEITWQEETGALHAANRAADLRAFFGARSVRKFDRAARQPLPHPLPSL